MTRVKRNLFSILSLSAGYLYTAYQYWKNRKPKLLSLRDYNSTKMVGSDFRCQHCSLNLTSMDQYTQHLAGRKHLKKLKSLGLSPAEQGPSSFPTSTGAASGVTSTATSSAGKVVSPAKPSSKPPPVSQFTSGSIGSTCLPSEPIAQSPLRTGKPSKPPAAHFKSPSSASLPSEPIAQSPLHFGKSFKSPAAQFKSPTTTSLPSEPIAQSPLHFGKPSKPLATQFASSTTAGSKLSSSSDLLAQITPKTGGTDPVMSAIKANMQGSLPTKRKAYSGRCELCNVTYTSASHEDQHLAGQKHKKKVKISGGGGKEATFFCSFCSVTVNSQFQMEQHREDTGSLSRPGQFTSPVTGSASLPSVPIAQNLHKTEHSDPVFAAVKANMEGSLPTQRKAYSGKCELCNVTYTSEELKNLHLSGQKHARRVKLSGDGSTGGTFFCRFCKVAVNSQLQMDQHRAGTVHQRNVEAARMEQLEHGPSGAKRKYVPSSATGSFFCNYCSVYVNSEAQMEEHKAGTVHQKNVEGIAGGIFCSYCSVYVNSESQMEQHKAGTVHKTNVESAHMGQSANGPSVAKRKYAPGSASGGIFCSYCSVHVNSVSQMEQHKAGTVHQKNVEGTACGIFCSYCSVTVNSESQMEQHKAGTVHQKNVEEAQMKPPTNGPSAAKKQCVPSSAVSGIFCSFCKVTVNSQIQMDQHKTGTVHLRNVNGSCAVQKTVVPSPAAGGIFCSYCKVTVNSQLQMDQHKTGTVHLRNVEGVLLKQFSSRPSVPKKNFVSSFAAGGVLFPQAGGLLFQPPPPPPPF